MVRAPRPRNGGRGQAPLPELACDQFRLVEDSAFFTRARRPAGEQTPDHREHAALTAFDGQTTIARRRLILWEIVRRACARAANGPTWTRVTYVEATGWSLLIMRPLAEARAQRGNEAWRQRIRSPQ